MKRTHVHIDSPSWNALVAMSKDRETPVSVLIRQALAEFIARQPEVRFGGQGATIAKPHPIKSDR